MKMWKRLIFVVILGCSATSNSYTNAMSTCLNAEHWCWFGKPTCDVIKLNSKNQIQVWCDHSINNIFYSCFFNCTLTTVSPITLDSKDDSRHSLTVEYASFVVTNALASNGQFVSGEERTWFQSNVTFSEILLNGSCIVEAIAASSLGTPHHDLDVSNCVRDVNLNWEIIPVNGLDVTWKVVTLTKFTNLYRERSLSDLLNCSVNALYMTNDAIGVIRNDTFPALPTLQLLDLSRCSLISVEDFAFSRMTNLKYLNLAGNQLEKIPNAVLSLPKIQFLNFSQNGHLIVDRLELCKLYTLRNLDLSFNTFNYKASTFEGKEIMASLKILNISSTRYISIAFLEMVPNLEMLIWTHIGPVVTGLFDLTNKANVFRALMELGLKQLITLDISNSEIVEDDFNWDAFYNRYQHLRCLNLANNNIKKLQSINVGHSLNVSRVLNLSGNKIELWTDEIINETASLNFEVDLTRNNIKGVSESMIEDFSKFNVVYLSGNLWNCGNCSLLPFLDWLKKNTTKTDYHKSPYTCAAPFRVKGHILNADSLPRHCFVRDNANHINDSAIIASVSVVVLLFAVTVALVFYHRRRRLQARLAARRSDCHELSRAMHYDAFISYCSADCDWVVEYLIPQLEQREPKLHLCIHERDFLAGGTIINNVIECIDNSRKTVFLITRRFIKSNWCQWELEMAQHKLFEEGNDVLVLVMLETLTKRQLPRLLQLLVSTRTYLQWPGHSATQQDCDLFWSRLRQFIGPCNCIKEQLQQADILC